MKLSFIDKIVEVFKYMFSSFLSIELFVLCLLLFLLLLFNIKRKNKYVNYIVIAVYIIFLISTIIAAPNYVGYSIDAFIKKIMNYIYFPSTATYFFIMLCSGAILIYSMYSKKITTFKKVFNYSVVSFMLFFFISFVVVASYNKLDIRMLEDLYKNDTLLSIVQISNFLLFGWILYTGFYKLFRYYKKKYDKKIEEN